MTKWRYCVAHAFWKFTTSQPVSQPAISALSLNYVLRLCCVRACCVVSYVTDLAEHTDRHNKKKYSLFCVPSAVPWFLVYHSYLRRKRLSKRKSTSANLSDKTAKHCKTLAHILTSANPMNIWKTKKIEKCANRLFWFREYANNFHWPRWFCVHRLKSSVFNFWSARGFFGSVLKFLPKKLKVTFFSCATSSEKQECNWMQQQLHQQTVKCQFTRFLVHNCSFN